MASVQIDVQFLCDNVTYCLTQDIQIDKTTTNNIITSYLMRLH